MQKLEFPKITAVKGPILVTGHTGFKGSWLVMLLREMGLEVAGMSLPAQEDSLFAKADISGEMREFIGDIQDFNFVKSAFLDLQPSVVIHLAAQSLVPESYVDPITTFGTNVMGTSNILESCRVLREACVAAIITTDKVYKNNETGIAFSESDELSGNEPYSASKVGAEQAVNAWRKISPEAKILSLRAGNVIGGGDFSMNRLLPDIVKSKYFGSKLKIRNLEATRPWQHVLDPLSGYLAAIEYALEGGTENTFNFGPNERSFSVEQVLNTTKMKWNDITYTHENQTNFVQESQYLELDSSLAQKTLRWNPRLSQKQAIHSTLDWWEYYCENRLDCREITLDQIRQYINFDMESGF